MLSLLHLIEFLEGKEKNKTKGCYTEWSELTVAAGLLK
jgi:hypothetical protein